MRVTTSLLRIHGSSRQVSRCDRRDCRTASRLGVRAPHQANPVKVRLQDTERFLDGSPRVTTPGTAERDRATRRTPRAVVVDCRRRRRQWPPGRVAPPTARAASSSARGQTASTRLVNSGQEILLAWATCSRRTVGSTGRAESKDWTLESN